MFYSRDLLALLELEPNDRYVPIAALCEALGIDRRTEERRVRAHRVMAAGAQMLTVETEHGDERALCLRVDLLPFWLAGIDAGKVVEAARARLEAMQRECASVLWQAFRPQGFGPEDALLPPLLQQRPVEQAYAGALAMATLARHQLLIERQLDLRPDYDETGDPYAAGSTIDDPQAALLARAVRRVALAAAERTRRNEYPGIYSGLYRQFGIASYRRMPPARLHEALEWLERWRGDLMGEPEPPPDI